jgi:nicotinamidase-related amidase
LFLERPSPRTSQNFRVVPEADVVEHCCSSGFANTDLDLQLEKHGIHKLIIIGLRANTCVESTVRFAAELGYEVTMVRDATASFSDEETLLFSQLNGIASMNEIFPLEDAQAAYDRTMSGKARFRVVLKIDS